MSTLAAMTANELHFAYVSELMPDLDVTMFGQICRDARSRNLERGIAGVLLFDVDERRFFQWLYGQQAAVRRLAGALALDPRHKVLSVHLEAQLPPLEADPTWRTGFIDTRALNAFVELDRDDRPALFAGIERLVDLAVLEPPLGVDALRLARAARR
jgi:Sensors of blue-light using FAD